MPPTSPTPDRRLDIKKKYTGKCNEADDYGIGSAAPPCSWLLHSEQYRLRAVSCLVMIAAFRSHTCYACIAAPLVTNFLSVPWRDCVTSLELP
jgi:hypothetical protein